MIRATLVMAAAAAVAACSGGGGGGGAAATPASPIVFDLEIDGSPMLLRGADTVADNRFAFFISASPDLGLGGFNGLGLQPGWYSPIPDIFGLTAEQSFAGRTYSAQFVSGIEFAVVTVPLNSSRVTARYSFHELDGTLVSEYAVEYDVAYVGPVDERP